MVSVSRLWSSNVASLSANAVALSNTRAAFEAATQLAVTSASISDSGGKAGGMTSSSSIAKTPPSDSSNTSGKSPSWTAAAASWKAS